MIAKEKIVLYTDGGSRGNPGIAGAGAVIKDHNGKTVKKISKLLGVVTNNEAEYQAIILGLETLKRLYGSDKVKNYNIEIRSDSELVVSQLRGEYQIKEEKLIPFFIKIWNLQVKDFPKISFVHIPREQNCEADGLANEAMDQSGAERQTLFT